MQSCENGDMPTDSCLLDSVPVSSRRRHASIETVASFYLSAIFIFELSLYAPATTRCEKRVRLRSTRTKHRVAHACACGASHGVPLAPPRTREALSRFLHGKWTMINNSSRPFHGLQRGTESVIYGEMERGVRGICITSLVEG